MTVGQFHGCVLDATIIAGHAFQLDIEPITEQRLEGQQTCLGQILAVVAQGCADRPTWTAGQTDDALGDFRHHIGGDVHRLAGWCLQIGPADQSDQVGVADFICSNERDGAQVRPLLAAVALSVVALAAKCQVDLAAHDRLNTVLDRLLGEFQRAEQVVGVGDRDGRSLILDGVPNDRSKLQRAFQQ